MPENKKISERAQKILDLLCLLNPCHPGLEPGSRIPHQVRNDEILAPGQIWIRQATLAEHFGCSRTTIWRMLKELKEAKLMLELGQKYLNRYKTYFVSRPPVQNDRPKSELTKDKEEIEALLAKHGAEWQRRHPYFGTGDKPTLRQWVSNMILLGKPFRIRLGQGPEEWIENNFIGTEKWAVEWAMAIVARQKREQQQEPQKAK